MSKRVVLAGLFHETHTFLSGKTALAEFEERVGGDLWSADNDGSPLAGMLGVARESKWDVLPAIDLRATPGPMVEDAVVRRFWNQFEAVVVREQARGIDGVCLVLHGAMVSESLRDVEGEILDRIRQLLGDRVPVCGVLDLHGNITPRMAALSNGLVAYCENPHADAHAAARRGALILDRLMRSGQQAVTLYEHARVMWPPTGTGTAFEPMRTLEAMARRMEQEDPELLAVNVFAGFSFADIPETGVSFTIVTVGDPARARDRLQELTAYAQAHRDEGNVRETPLAEVLEKLKSSPTGPVVLAEPSDNIGGGAPGDGTTLLKAFVESRLQNAAVAINDPQAVTALRGTRIGDVVKLDIGGKESPLSGGPARLEVTLLSRRDGRFTLEDPNSHLASMSGMQFDMGPCAVVQHGGIRILLTSHKTPPFDLAQWRSQGIEPEKLAVIAVKAAVAHRRVYDRIAAAHYTVETPGPCSSNLQSFPWRYLQRPIYPLDE